MQKQYGTTLVKTAINIFQVEVVKFLQEKGFDFTAEAVVVAYKAVIEWALSEAEKAFPAWSQKPVGERKKLIDHFANLLEENIPELLALAALEAGKTWNDGIGEVREAVDFCRYYGYMAEKLMAKPTQLHGYTGELNELSLHGRGVVLCISPWNFPLAIFIGQVIAALATGNTVIAKPAEQTSLMAMFAVQLMHKEESQQKLSNYYQVVAKR